MTYEEWGNYHLTTFGMTTPENILMIGTWCELFASAMITPEELMMVTRWLALHDPPKFRADHLIGIQQRIREQRRDAAAYTPPDQGRGTCTQCGGCGVIAVPGAGMTTIGGNIIPVDSEQTIAVSCSCALGQWMMKQYRGDKPMMQLVHYSDMYPRWRDEMKRLNELPKQRARALENAKAADRKDGPVKNDMDKVMARILAKSKQNHGSREPGEDG